jgi:hypothetical protein
MLQPVAHVLAVRAENSWHCCRALQKILHWSCKRVLMFWQDTTTMTAVASRLCQSTSAYVFVVVALLVLVELVEEKGAEEVAARVLARQLPQRSVPVL